MSSPRYCKAWRLKTSQVGKLRVPSAPVAERVRYWAGQGYTYEQIAESAKCSHSTISGLGRERYSTVKRTIAEKILAAQPGPVRTDEYLPLDATGTRRRLQALIAIGHPHGKIAAAIGHSTGALSKILNGHYPTVRGTTARAVAELYRQWSKTPGSCVRSRNRANAEGWAGPMAWGPEIDDPTATPEPEPEPNRAEKSAVDEVAHLAAFGITPAEIATRLNLSTDYVRTTIRTQRALARAA